MQVHIWQRETIKLSPYNNGSAHLAKGGNKICLTLIRNVNIWKSKVIKSLQFNNKSILWQWQFIKLRQWQKMSQFLYREGTHFAKVDN